MKVQPRKKSTMFLLMFNIFLAFAGVGLVIPIMPTYMRELGISGQTVGFLVAAFSLTQLLLSPLSGRLSDRWGRKKMIVAGMFIFAISEFIFGIANSMLVLYVSRLLGGLGAALITPSIMAYIADITTTNERAKGMGYISAAISTGFIIGPGIGGFVAEYGIRVPFYSAAAAAGIAGLFTLFILPESMSAEERNKKWRKADKSESLARQLIKSYKAPYFIGLVIVFVLALGLSSFETVFGLYVDIKYGFTPQDIAKIITFGTILGAVVQITVFGALLKRFGEKMVISICIVVAGVFLFLTLYANSYWAIVVVTFVIFLASDILRPTISTLLSKLAGEEQGFIAGMNSSYTSLGNIAGPSITGVLFDVNIDFPYIFAAFAMLVCFVISVRWGKRVALKMN
ncbi:tetracycline resistance MFS efflux pump [Paenibacillus baekrokdamisoli]|uniref:Tetracycline resistance MFS efflux pump n=1 Tax=Paenibacillus baekrokdamisoli TaxID=1712516 RepID=A0A3G9JBP1_9BACL|nr:MFS transporter [Paenibacillus baekrokdamisoli]MBB3069954.1 DHA1 family multidrug resistance protein-like MFS transporter [Paenibacillus baekrokdamisoli]BBH20694.1 tetracycline resistance MFS efflux pump [Paenibacillus baekrokdamisoli]